MFKPLQLKLICQQEDESRATKSVESLRIMRTRLQQTLLSRIPASFLKFGKTCISANPPKSKGKHIELTFQDGSSTKCDILIVADGANSKLRTMLLPNEVNNYAGICMVFVSSFGTLGKLFTMQGQEESRRKLK